MSEYPEQIERCAADLGESLTSCRRCMWPIGGCAAMAEQIADDDDETEAEA